MARDSISKVNTTGAAGIVDRVEGWGHTAGSDSNRKDNGTWTGASITATDASKESTSSRLGRWRKARQAAKAGDNVEIADRTLGVGGTFDASDGADEQYGYDNMEDETPSDLGTDRDLDAPTGSNTAYTTSDAEAASANRTVDQRDTVDLDDSSAEKRAEAARTSIVDRTSGWGHTSGSFTYRND